ncbi:hypothetical protein AG0111_0g11778 [Alternaria gaisen]|uniref:Uncharacterized protein n=1 Tax=Alternaria gaisen TaxID=167740 RepID=A0ACB6F6W3_9PLEO|nr:hypothetical protein AG0111_0g11778 [Alternaria gaisen]
MKAVGAADNTVSRALVSDNNNVVKATGSMVFSVSKDGITRSET